MKTYRLKSSPGCCTGLIVYEYGGSDFVDLCLTDLTSFKVGEVWVSLPRGTILMVKREDLEEVIE